MNRLIVFSAMAAGVYAACLPADARACDLAVNSAHVVDPSLQASDQTPPTLPAIPSPHIRHGDGTQGCRPSDCADVGSVTISAVATDETTMPGNVGYRLSLAGGTLPASLTLPETAVNPLASFLILYFDADDVDALDFTLQVVAIDAAGNESAPQMVRVRDDTSGCTIARGRHSGRSLGWFALAALLLAARRRRR